jgi:polygalacturonase
MFQLDRFKCAGLLACAATLGTLLFNAGCAATNSNGSAAAWDQVPEILARIVPPRFPAKDFPVSDYGAVAGGTVKSTEAFAKAIAACHDAGGGRVVVPKGKFLTGPIHLRNNVELHLSEGAEVIFSDKFEDYLPPVLVRVGGVELYNYSPLIYARDCRNIAVTGPGILDGNSKAWWEWSRRETKQGFQMGAQGVPVEQRVFGTPEAAIRPSFLSFVSCTNILLEDIKIGSGPNRTIHPIY